ncbi:MAG TPA: hypothetical protein VL984_13505, partial [Acidimicrobiales bacterium]|nr:hypothetical protein [Acidimicrobiales bacterium]
MARERLHRAALGDGAFRTGHGAHALRGPHRGRRAVLATTAALAAVLSGAAPALAKAPTTTQVLVTLTASGQLSSAYTWAVQESASPTTQMVRVATSAQVTWQLAVTKSASTTETAQLSGSACAYDVGLAPTQGLAITDQLTKLGSKTVLYSGALSVAAEPVIAALGHYCYPYVAPVPPGSITPGAVYELSAHVSITNRTGSPGTPSGPSTAALALLPRTPTTAYGSLSVSDSNGQHFSFSSSGTQSYLLSYACPASPVTLSETDTATAQGTGQSSTATATVHCGGPTTLTTMLSSATTTTTKTVSDQATITGAQAGAGGTISYAVYSDNACSTLYADATPATNTVSNGVAPSSASVSFSSPGTYYFVATYSGDPSTNTLGSQSSCSAEPVTVTSACAADGTIGCPWQVGDLTTYDQQGWVGTDPAQLLTDDFFTVYLTGLIVGDNTNGGLYIAFDSPQALLAYLPAPGAAGQLNASALDPTSTSAGSFGGDV